MSIDHWPKQTAIRTDLGAIFVSLELSRSVWLITSLSPGAGEKMSKHSVRSGDVAGLLARFAHLKQKAQARTGQIFPILIIQEAGLDGFWIHRVLQSEGIESYVVDPASIATSRRRRRAKTDKIDGEALVRALLAYKRGEPRVCAMVKAPTPDEEDRRRLSRERKTLMAERIQHVNRIKGLLFAQGIGDYEPLHRNRRDELDRLMTGDGRPLPKHLKAQIRRELDRLDLLLEQIKAVEVERDALLAPDEKVGAARPAAMLLGLKGVGSEFAAILRYGAANGFGVRIDDGDVEALIARTLPRRRSTRRKSFETDLLDGRWFWIEHTVLANEWVMTVATDISALKHNEKSLRQAHESALLASRTDLLTGLPNRRYILELLDEGLAAGMASGAGLCVAIIDIDQFKTVNDTYGHEAGDAVLRHFAQIFRESLRPGNHLGRIGGEEFLLLLADVRLDDAARLINGIRAGFPPVTMPDQATRRPIAFSAGLTAALPHDDRSSILYRADRALYVAKAEGRNCTRVGLGMDRAFPGHVAAQEKMADRT